MGDQGIVDDQLTRTRALLIEHTPIDTIESAEAMEELPHRPGRFLVTYFAIGWSAGESIDIASSIAGPPHIGRLHAVVRLARQQFNGRPCPECGRRTVFYDSMTERTSLDPWMRTHDPLHELLCALFYDDDAGAYIRACRIEQGNGGGT